MAYCQIAEQTVMCAGRRPSELLGDVGAEFHEVFTRNRQLFLGQRRAQWLGVAINPLHNDIVLIWHRVRLYQADHQHNSAPSPNNS